MSNAIQKRNGDELVKLFADIDGRMTSWKKVLPAKVSQEWFAAECKVAVQRNPDLMTCTRVSLFDSLLTCAQLGLSPSGRLGSAHLIPFKTSVQVGGGKWEKATVCQLVIGYRGYIDLARRSGEVKGFGVEVVYEGENFRDVGGLHPTVEHDKDRDTDEKQSPDKLYAVYAWAELADGFRQHVVLYRPDINRAKAAARGADNAKSPWVTHTAEQWKKTAIRRLVKLLPLSPDRAQLLARAEEVEDAQWSADVVDAVVEEEASTTGTDGLKRTLTDRRKNLNTPEGRAAIAAGREKWKEQHGSYPEEAVTEPTPAWKDDEVMSEMAQKRGTIPMSHPDAQPPEPGTEG